MQRRFRSEEFQLYFLPKFGGFSGAGRFDSATATASFSTRLSSRSIRSFKRCSPEMAAIGAAHAWLDEGTDLTHGAEPFET